MTTLTVIPGRWYRHQGFDHLFVRVCSCDHHPLPRIWVDAAYNYTTDRLHSMHAPIEVDILMELDSDESHLRLQVLAAEREEPRESP